MTLSRVLSLPEMRISLDDCSVTPTALSMKALMGPAPATKPQRPAPPTVEAKLSQLAGKWKVR